MSYPLSAGVHLEAEVEYIEKMQDGYLRLQDVDFAVSWSGIVEIELAAGLGTSEEWIDDWHIAAHRRRHPWVSEYVAVRSDYGAALEILFPSRKTLDRILMVTLTA